MNCLHLLDWAATALRALRPAFNFRIAVRKILQSKIQVLTIAPLLLNAACRISQRSGLLSSDAVIVAVTRAHDLTNLASNDTDFDRVPGLAPYAPV
jgi:predicted nucleic acid-binding protein